MLAPDSARAAIREMFLSHVIGGKHLELARRLHRDGPRGHARRGAHRCRAARPRPRRGAPRRRRRGGRRRRRRHHRRALRGRARPGGGRPSPGRSSPPRRSPAPSRATSACAGRRSRRWRRPASTTRRRRRSAVTTTPACCPATDEECAEDEAIAHRRRRPGPAPARRPLPGRGRPRRPGGRAQRQGPARGRPAGRVRAGCSATAARESRAGCSPAAPARSRAAGSCPGARGSSSTTTTCWPPPGCSPRAHPDAAYRLVRSSLARTLGSLSPVKNDDGHADTGDEVAEGRRRFARLKPRASETEDAPDRPDRPAVGARSVPSAVPSRRSIDHRAVELLARPGAVGPRPRRGLGLALPGHRRRGVRRRAGAVATSA